MWQVLLAGELDPAALESALAAVTARHGALRTHFVEAQAQAGGFAQAVLPPGAEAAAVRMHRAALPNPSDLAAALQRRAVASFNLFSVAPCWRAALYIGGGGVGGNPQSDPSSNGAGAGEAVLLLVAHAAVADRWSLALLLSEVQAAYAALRGGDALPPEPALQLADVAAWQARSSLCSADMAAALMGRGRAAACLRTHALCLPGAKCTVWGIGTPVTHKLAQYRTEVSSVVCCQFDAKRIMSQAQVLPS